MGGRGPRGQMSFEERLGDLRWRQAALTGALVAVRKPTIAALPGAAAGAGLAIALACDIRIAARSAFVSTGYARVGLSGDYGIAWLLTRAVGSARARELMFTAERVDAERCERIGLVNRVVADAKLQDEAFAFAKSLAEGPRVALRNMKDNLDDALHIDYPTALHREAERLVQASRTEDHKEAVRAFVEKRKPVFVGRASTQTVLLGHACPWRKASHDLERPPCGRDEEPRQTLHRHLAAVLAFEQADQRLAAPCRGRRRYRRRP